MMSRVIMGNSSSISGATGLVSFLLRCSRTGKGLVRGFKVAVGRRAGTDTDNLGYSYRPTTSRRTSPSLAWAAHRHVEKQNSNGKFIFRKCFIAVVHFDANYNTGVACWPFCGALFFGMFAGTSAYWSVFISKMNLKAYCYDTYECKRQNTIKETLEKGLCLI